MSETSQEPRQAAPPDGAGDARVDAALARLGELAGRPAAEHVEVYEDIHRRLQDTLTGAAEPDPGPPRPGPRPGP